MKAKNFNLVGFALALSALTACGGGEGSGATTAASAPSAQPAPVVTPVSTASTLVTAVSPSTYAVGSEEAAAFDKLNAERNACGFGLLAQNANLDVAAKGHANWNVLNGYFGHFQIAGTPGFTGVTPQERFAKAGYTVGQGSTVGDESTSVIYSGNKVGFGKVGMVRLLNAPYHLAGLMSGFREVGFSVLSSDDIAGSALRQVTLQANLAYKDVDQPQLIDGSSVATYPCEGSTGINRQLADETPNPVPGRDLSRLPLGSSVYIAVRDGNKLTITNASLTNLATGVPVTVRPVLNSDSDPNKVNGQSYFAGHQAFITADAPMAANTRYQVVINGTNNGAAFNRTFIFTTGTGG
ncbi:Allergen V5/Tpx-1 family protein (plasmid) [Polaromonas naphthalenivorans CJ2]|uniref:Allergen V5/Tpx-1 family protein n=2 Tax=Polaromonas naphthalenivorans TaxID=216465 RepID=A1VVE0_POLNA|nr:Allergen V5/Tpx-1 family protein [Polaromonas naphthalenivorans CJ2]